METLLKGTVRTMQPVRKQQGIGSKNSLWSTDFLRIDMPTCLWYSLLNKGWESINKVINVLWFLDFFKPFVEAKAEKKDF